MGIFSKAKDPMSSLTHFVGAVASLIFALIAFICGVFFNTSLPTMISLVIFGLSAVALYSASSIYHFYNKDDSHPTKIKLRKLDHAMIYVLIVGSYTPFLVEFLEAPKCYIFVGILWFVAIVGIIVKLFWLNAPRWLSTVFYLGLGWSILFDINAFAAMDKGCLFLVALGGASYTIGAFIYIFKKPNLFKIFNFHDLFHIFVMIGTMFHFIALYQYVL